MYPKLNLENLDFFRNAEEKKIKLRKNREKFQKRHITIFQGFQPKKNRKKCVKIEKN